MFLRAIGFTAVFCVLLAPGPYAAPLASHEAARDLVRALDAVGSNAIAAADPQAPRTFIAALYIPGSQLLVVSARHPDADGVAYRVVSGQHRDVYLDLQGTPTPQDKFFVQDANADGILSARPGSGQVDVLYEDGVRQTLFNGDFRAQHLTAAAYDEKLAEADAQYARLLRLLVPAVRAQQQSESGSATPAGID
jgi:hypothetical protein